LKIKRWLSGLFVSFRSFFSTFQPFVAELVVKISGKVVKIRRHETVESFPQYFPQRSVEEKVSIL